MIRVQRKNDVIVFSGAVSYDIAPIFYAQN